MHLKSVFILSFTIFFIRLNFAQDIKFIPALPQLDSILKTNCSLMKQININDVDMLMVNDCKLNEVEATLEWLSYVNIASQIDFKKQEEISIYEYFKETTLQTAQLRVVINQYISNLDFWYYKKAMEYLAIADTNNAIDKFEKSLLINPFYIPSLYQKAMMYLMDSQTKQASKIAEFVALNLYPDGSDRMLIKAMNEQINKQFKTKAEKLLAAGYCNESLEIFMQADTFCNYFKSDDCEYFKKGILLSKRGMYHSYLRVADHAMDAFKYTIAETFIMKAKEYASANRSAVSSDEEADKYLKRISAKYMDLAMNYKRSGDDARSLGYLEKTRIICSLLNDKEFEAILLKREAETVNSETSMVADKTTILADNSNSIVSKKQAYKRNGKKHSVRTKRRNKSKKSNTIIESPVLAFKQKHKTKNNTYSLYTSLVETGNEYAGVLKYEPALEKYKEAKALETKVLPIKNAVLDSLIDVTAFNSINSHLQTAGFLIWANELTQADSVYNFCKDLQQKYNLEKDVLTIAALEQFRKKITDKTCQSIQDEINQLNSKAGTFISIREFTKAQLCINDARNLFIKNNNCRLSMLKTDQLSHRIQPVTDYEHLKEIAKSAYEKEDYKLFTESFSRADLLYLQYEIDTFGIPNNNIVAYLNYQSNEKALLFAVNYFVDFYNFKNCLEILKLLKNNGVEAIKVKDIQQKLAIQQAKADRLLPQFNEEEYIMKYTKNEKWFKVFNTEYRKK